MQVVPDMSVLNLKDKLWNISGLHPSAQRLVMPNGGELTDSMDFASSGLQPGDSLLLRTA